MRRRSRPALSWLWMAAGWQGRNEPVLDVWEDSSVAMASRGKLLTAIDLLGCLIGKFRRPTVDACSILQRWWAKTDAAVVGGSASEDQVRALEQRYNVSLPEDFRAYLRTACPAAECWDAEGTAWWSLALPCHVPKSIRRSRRCWVARHPRCLVNLLPIQRLRFGPGRVVLDRIKNIPDEYAHQIKNLDIAPHSSQYLFLPTIWSGVELGRFHARMTITGVR